MMLPPFDPWRTLTAVAQVSMASSASEAELASLQARRLKALLVASQKSPLYRRVLGGREPAAWRLDELPVMDKAHLMARFDEWVTDPALKLGELRAFMAAPAHVGAPFKDRFMAWESSGSHGAPGVFVQDAATLAVYDALEFLRRRLPHPLHQAMDPFGLADTKVFIGATGGHFASTLSIERLKRLNPLLAGTLHSLSFLEPLPHLVARLTSLQPAVLATYPSVAVLLSEERLAGRLDIAPREIWTGGETLTAGMRHLISQAFGCTVIDSYGASEFLCLASECPHGVLHLNSDWAILESVDDDGRTVPAGQAGSTTLLTNLANHLQPIIRYDLGDRISFHGEPCACGSHLPTLSVAGRSGDLMHLRGAGERCTSIPFLALVTVLESVEGLPDFQLQQHSLEELTLSSEMDTPSVRSALRKAALALQGFLGNAGVPAVCVRCLPGRPSRRTCSGKVERVVAMP